MPRLNKREQTTRYDFDTIVFEITKKTSGAMSILGWVKDSLTNLPYTQLFKDEEELGALVDDLGDALDIIRKEKEGNDGE